jgi:hypothetical protein
LGWPGDGKITIKALASNSTRYPGKIRSIERLGSAEKPVFTRDENGLTVTVPGAGLSNYATALKITPMA